MYKRQGCVWVVAIKHYLEICNNKRAVVFCVSIKHSQHVVDQFNRSGIKSVHIDGKTKIENRDKAIEDFKKGIIKVLSNVDLFGEGFDLPALDAVILLRPTKSLGLYLQQVGRSLRPFDGKKEAIILDHVGNCQEHGLPDDDRNWTLEQGKSKNKKDKNQISVRICIKCFNAQRSTFDKCQSCGYIFDKKPRQVDEVDGNLVEIDLTKARRLRMSEQRVARSFDDLVKLGRARGYKRPYLWAKHITNYRKSKELQNAST